MPERTDKVNHKESIIQLWFTMWLQKNDLGIQEIFSKDAVYIESWGPAYRGNEKIKLWFDVWNTRGSVLQWDIKQYFHKENQTMVEWFFKNQMKNGTIEMFDGVSLIQWTQENKIEFLKEFGCNINHYDPYQNDVSPSLRRENSRWF